LGEKKRTHVLVTYGPPLAAASLLQCVETRPEIDMKR